jgi:hypothetical protein
LRRPRARGRVPSVTAREVRGSSARRSSRGRPGLRDEWLSYSYELANETPAAGRIEVDRGGRVRTFEQASKEEIEELLATLPPTRKQPGAPPPAKAKAKANGKANAKVTPKPKPTKTAKKKPRSARSRAR